MKLTREHILPIVKRKMEEAGLNPHRLAKLAGLHPNVTSDWFSGRSKMISPEKLEAIFGVLKIEYSTRGGVRESAAARFQALPGAGVERSGFEEQFNLEMTRLFGRLPEQQAAQLDETRMLALREWMVDVAREQFDATGEVQLYLSLALKFFEKVS